MKASVCVWKFFFFQAEDGIRDLVRSRGLGDVYKRQCKDPDVKITNIDIKNSIIYSSAKDAIGFVDATEGCLLYTSDAADERSSVDLGGRRIIKKKKRDR